MFVLRRLTTLHSLLLAVILVVTQTLGLVHAITHGSLGSSFHLQHDGHSHSHDHFDVDVDVDVGDHDHDHDHAEAGKPGVNHFLASFFSSHQDVSDCRLFDHASHDSGFVLAVQSPLRGAPPPLTVAIFQGEALARWAALFNARGPPLTV